MIIWAAIGLVVSAAANYLGGKKKQAAMEKARKEGENSIRVAGAENRRDIEYQSALNEWRMRRDKARKAAGAANYADFGRQNPGPNSALNAMARENSPVVARDPGAVPALPQSLSQGSQLPRQGQPQNPIPYIPPRG